MLNKDTISTNNSYTIKSSENFDSVLFNIATYKSQMRNSTFNKEQFLKDFIGYALYTLGLKKVKVNFDEKLLNKNEGVIAYSNRNSIYLSPNILTKKSFLLDLYAISHELKHVQNYKRNKNFKKSITLPYNAYLPTYKSNLLVECGYDDNTLYMLYKMNANELDANNFAHEFLCDIINECKSIKNKKVSFSDKLNLTILTTRLELFKELETIPEEMFNNFKVKFDKTKNKLLDDFKLFMDNCNTYNLEKFDISKFLDMKEKIFETLSYYNDEKFVNKIKNLCLENYKTCFLYINVFNSYLNSQYTKIQEEDLINYFKMRRYYRIEIDFRIKNLDKKEVLNTYFKFINENLTSDILSKNEIKNIKSEEDLIKVLSYKNNSYLKN